MRAAARTTKPAAMATITVRQVPAGSAAAAARAHHQWVWIGRGLVLAFVVPALLVRNRRWGAALGAAFAGVTAGVVFTEDAPSTTSAIRTSAARSWGSLWPTT